MEIPENAIKDSTSLTVLLISSIFVITSIAQAEEKYIFFGLFFLLYAITNHYLSVYSKIESIRKHARGGWRFWLFGLIFWLLFILWIWGSISLLFLTPTTELTQSYSCFLKLHFPFLFSIRAYFVSLIVFFAILIIWISTIFFLVHFKPTKK